MTYYLLPYSDLQLYEFLEYKSTNQPNEPPPLYISESLAHYLYEMKVKIEDKDKKWDIYKKYTNPYEYIHTNVPFKNKCIAKHKPLSRSYFKMVEMCNIFSILEKYHTISSIQTFHLAEGPGGFIEAVARYRNNPEDKYYGMTLQDKNPNVPAWKKTGEFLHHFPNVHIENGSDNTGNILSLENFDHVVNKYKNIDVITADGGFDFSMDFNKQETFIAKLLYAQTAFAISIQKRDGTFILKIFDVFMRHTVDILNLLSSFYKHVYIMKPHTSRYANSEKYVICMGFLYEHSESYKYVYYLRNALKDMLSNEESIPLSFLKIPPCSMFLQKIEEYNAIFGQKQMQNIQYTMTLIENKNKFEKIDTLVKTNMKKCIEWCTRHNISRHYLPDHSNIFIPY